MEIKIYAYQDNSTGRITNYKDSLIKDYNGGCALETFVEIPDYLNPYTAVTGDICIDYKGFRGSLGDMLFCQDGKPKIHFADMEAMKDKYITLKIVKEGEWKSTSKSI